jgi:hypothetical protein
VISDEQFAAMAENLADLRASVARMATGACPAISPFGQMCILPVGHVDPLHQPPIVEQTDPDDPSSPLPDPGPEHDPWPGPAVSAI